VKATDEALADASATLNKEMHRFPWKRDSAIAAVTVTPLEGSPSTPAWYGKHTGDVSINLLAVYEDDERLARSVLRRLVDGHDVPPVILGMLAHETAHSRWSTWMPDESCPPAAAEVMIMLDELRIEKRAADWTPAAKEHLRHSFHWLLKRMVAAELDTRPRAIAHAWALTYGRYRASIASLTEVHPVDDVIRTALGEDTVDTLLEILEEAIQTDSVMRLQELAEEWLRTLGEDDEEESGPVIGLFLHGEGSGEPASGEGGELAEVLAASIEEVASSIEESPMPPDDGGADLADPSEMVTKVFGHGYGPSTHRQAWKVRDPSPQMRNEALRFARTLEQLALPSVTLTRVPDTLPPGRLRGREAVRQSAERSMGMMTTATPWERTRRRRTTSRPIIVGCMTDTSGSMNWAQGFVADFAWMMATAGQRVGARTAAVTFGNNAEMVTRPNEVPVKVREREANGGHEAFDYAGAAMEGVLHLSTPITAAKVLFIVSDGHLVKPGEIPKAQRWMEKWTKGGTLIVWLGCDASRWRVLTKRCGTPGAAVNVPNVRTMKSHAVMQQMAATVIAAARGMS
jgi:hypothetical protein